MNFEQSFNQLMRFEGGFSDHPQDTGGPTNYGITEHVARAHGYIGDMRDMPIESAKKIYQRLYWDACRCDDLPAEVRYDVFDAAVNSGPAQSIKWLQRALGVPDDGVMGRVTIAAANEAKGSSRKFNGQRLMMMTTLGNWPTFGKGWARRIADNLMRAA